MNLDIVIPAFHSAGSICELLESIESQDKTGIAVTVYVVDDASTDQTFERISEFNARSFRLVAIQNLVNRGRSTARDIGIRSGKSEYILLLDSDCKFANENCLLAFNDAIRDDIDLYFGSLVGSGNNFWTKYFNLAQTSKTPERVAKFSTTNMLMRRDTYEAAGGFSNEYSKYGFEDRDLICRITQYRSNAFQFVMVEESIAVHRVNETIESYCRKQLASGQYSAEIFENHFPESYREMSYSKFDYHHVNLPKNFALNTLSLFSQPLKRIASFTTRRFGLRFFRFNLNLVRMLAALSFYQGTRKSRRISKLVSS